MEFHKIKMDKTGALKMVYLNADTVLFQVICDQRWKTPDSFCYDDLKIKIWAESPLDALKLQALE